MAVENSTISTRLLKQPGPSSIERNFVIEKWQSNNESQNNRLPVQITEPLEKDIASPEKKEHYKIVNQESTYTHLEKQYQRSAMRFHEPSCYKSIKGKG